MKRMNILPLVTACLALSGVSRAADDAHKGEADAVAVVKGNNEFAFQLYARLRTQEGNLFFSPYSISTALAMTYAGARGDTADEMARTLHFALPPDQLHLAFARVMDELNGAGRKRHFELHVANALWAQKGYPFRPDFTRRVKESYQAECRELDFAGATEKARQTINGWVEKKTKDRIKELFKAGVLDADTLLVLTNAIYFKAGWEHIFYKPATRKEEFRLTTKRKLKDAPMMHQSEEFRFFDGGHFQLLELPYARGELSMVVLLPKKVDGLDGLEKTLSATRLVDWLKQAKVYQVTVSLPKFKVTSEFSLNQVLSALGMKLAFTDRADFSGMTRSQKLMISAVVHKAFVAVDEKGTEAAAATGVAIKPTSAPAPRPRATFKADHPFVHLILDHRTGSVLFMGRVTNPRE
jgi:serpin B